jgi:hypothetical protein
MLERCIRGKTLATKGMTDGLSLRHSIMAIIGLVQSSEQLRDLKNEKVSLSLSFLSFQITKTILIGRKFFPDISYMRPRVVNGLA